MFCEICSAWVEETKLKPYVEHRDSIVKNIKKKALIEAVKRMDEYLRDPEVIATQHMPSYEFLFFYFLHRNTKPMGLHRNRNKKMRRRTFQRR